MCCGHQHTFSFVLAESADLESTTPTLPAWQDAPNTNIHLVRCFMENADVRSTGLAPAFV
jgi:hypothetical protein